MVLIIGVAATCIAYHDKSQYFNFHFSYWIKKTIFIFLIFKAKLIQKNVNTSLVKKENNS